MIITTKKKQIRQSGKKKNNNFEIHTIEQDFPVVDSKLQELFDDQFDRFVVEYHIFYPLT